MKKVTLLFLSLFLITACATSSKLTLPNGKQGYNIDCSGLYTGINACYEKAGSVCPDGYNIIANTKDKGINVDPFIGLSSHNKKGMLIECK